MSQSSRPARGSRVPHQSVMEMEEVFFQLCEEVARLQDLCAKQGKLLQKLTARKGPILDIPVSLPIQCTEDMVTEEAEKPSESRQECSQAPTSAAASPGSAHPLAQPHAADALPACNVTDPPSPEKAGVLSGGNGKAALAVAFGSQHCSKVERSEKGDLDTWLKNYGVLPTMKASKEEARACCNLLEFAVPDPEAVDSFLDLYEAPQELQREDASSESALPAAIHVPVEIRGPVKTSWTPAWTLEESLGQGAVFTSEAARTCDFCQAVFPSDAAAQADYLKHLLAHMK
ncbi:uncharacterized protein LOC112972126 [Apteryx rowi]|uniref:uncharacterized protein LOC112972126 n=1 Tax=Apteryx rowi TaxID=308060 RepID=UPI000E1C6F22|nr:uncharacterized protein LOC112972126 [Apteryx rowi]